MVPPQGKAGINNIALRTFVYGQNYFIKKKIGDAAFSSCLTSLTAFYRVLEFRCQCIPDTRNVDTGTVLPD
jgi:hypothetical protein